MTREKFVTVEDILSAALIESKEYASAVGKLEGITPEQQQAAHESQSFFVAARALDSVGLGALSESARMAGRETADTITTFLPISLLSFEILLQYNKHGTTICTR